jgi:hypothetical protein
MRLFPNPLELQRRTFPSCWRLWKQQQRYTNISRQTNATVIVRILTGSGALAYKDTDSVKAPSIVLAVHRRDKSCPAVSLCVFVRRFRCLLVR